MFKKMCLLIIAVLPVLSCESPDIREQGYRLKKTDRIILVGKIVVNGLDKLAGVPESVIQDQKEDHYQYFSLSLMPMMTPDSPVSPVYNVKKNNNKGYFISLFPKKNYYIGDIVMPFYKSENKESGFTLHFYTDFQVNPGLPANYYYVGDIICDFNGEKMKIRIEDHYESVQKEFDKYIILPDGKEAVLLKSIFKGTIAPYISVYKYHPLQSTETYYQIQIEE